MDLLGLNLRVNTVHSDGWKIEFVAYHVDAFSSTLYSGSIFYPFIADFMYSVLQTNKTYVLQLRL